MPTRDQVHSYFLPYNRISPPWTLYERVKTFLVLILLFPLRVLYLLLSTALLLFIASIATLGLPSMSPQTPLTNPEDPGKDFDNDPHLRPLHPLRKFFLSVMFPIARSMLFFSFGVYHIRHSHSPFLSAHAPPPSPASPQKAYVIVANHLGYIDILTLLCKYHGSFVAKGDLEHTPIIGSLARALQCMFVRPGSSLTSQLIYRVKSTYICHRKRNSCPGCPACLSKLVIFPEGTTTNGSAMVPFRTGVFNAGLPVKPVCIRFPHKHFNMSWETIRFREHIFRTMTQLVNYVEIVELPVYEPSEEEMHDSRLYAANVQIEMAEVLDQPIVPLNRKHKFLYHSWILGKEESEADVLKKARDMVMADDQLLYFEGHPVDGAV